MIRLKARPFMQTVLACFLVAQFLFLLVPWSPFSSGLSGLSDISVDVAFALAGPHFFLSHVQYGPEAIFTYGPLMFLATDPMGKAWLGNWVLLFRSALAGLTAVSIVFMILRCSTSIAVRSMAFVAAGFIGVLWSLGLADWLWIAAVIVVVVLHRPAERDFVWLLLASTTAIFCGIACLVKFTIAMVAGWSFLILAVSDLSRRKWPIPSLVFIVSFLLSWTLVAGQKLENLPTWLQLSLNISSGYSDAMSKGFYAPYGWPKVAGFYLAELAMLVAVGMSASRTLTLFFAALGFLGIKHAFGGNQIEQECLGLLFTGLCVVMLALRQPTPRHAGLRNGLIVFAVIVPGTILFGAEYVIRAFQMSGEAMVARVGSISAALDGAGAANGWDRYRGAVRIAADLPADLAGTTDIYPSKTVIPLSYPKLTYQARPAFLSLNAHTAELARRNRDFVRSSRAPDNILFEVLPDGHNVNRRLPATEDGMSWPDIFARYAVTGEKNDLLVLKRKTPPAELHFDPLVAGPRAFKEPIEVAARPMVWAQIDVQRSLRGALVNFVYKAPRIFIDITTDGGQVVSHELVPELGRAGFLLSPYVGTTEDFRDTMLGDPAPRHAVKRFAIRQEDGPAWLYKPAIGVTLSELRVGDLAQRPRPADDLLRSPDELARRAKDCVFPPSFFTLAETGERMVQMHAPCQTLVPVPPGAKSVTLRYGLRDTSYQAPDGHTGGATFKMAGQAAPDAPFKPLWATELDTFARPADRKMHTVTLPVGDAAVLRLETGIGSDGSPAYDHTYWGTLAFSR